MPHLKYYMQIINTQPALPPEDLIGKYPASSGSGENDG
jgi:hypothetical protein